MRLLITTILLLPFVVFAAAQNPIQPTLSPSTGLLQQTSIGETYIVTYSLKNTLAAPELLKKVLINTSGAGFTTTDTCSNTTLAANGASTCLITVKFQPTAAGNASAQLILQYDNNVVPLPALNTTVKAASTGTQITGVVTAPLPSTTSSGTSYQVQFTYVNNGSTSVTATGVPVTGDMTNVANNCTAALAPNATCTVTGTLVLNTVGFAKVGATYEYGTGDDADTAPLTTSTTVMSNASCAQVNGITTLALPSKTYEYADNVVQFTFTNNCVSGDATLGNVALTASLASADVSSTLSTGDDTCSGKKLAANASCIVSAAISSTSVGNSLSITATLPYGDTKSATVSTSASSVQVNNTQNRVLTVVNQCPYPVWMSFQPGNINSSTGPAVTHCKTDADCPADTSCNPGAAASAGLCYWSNPAMNGTHTNGRFLAALANSAPDTQDIVIPETNGQADGLRPAAAGGDTLFNGGLGVRLGCTGTGSSLKCAINDCAATGSDGLCKPGSGNGTAPVAFNAVEYTFQRTGTEGVYDMQIIDGINVPIEMKGRGPVSSGTAPYNSCSATGAVIQPAGPPTTALGNCSYQFAPTDATISRYVTPVTPMDLCNTDADCSGGTICGLGYEAVGNKINKVCGTLQGYVSVNKGICSQPTATFGVDKDQNNLLTTVYKNTFQCDKTFSAGYTAPDLYACTHPPMQTCYGSDTPCCGCVDWWNNQHGANLKVPSSTESCPQFNTDWQTLVQPTVQWVKAACPTAYVYQYDDKSSSFRCTVTNPDQQTVTNYQVTFCPGGKTVTAG
ncbi:MAG: hypothetical protein EXR81_05435 [Gammaproteobacteria bacterium]|nr:hypothetical protein [Gammaproteobacteria bacterium]